MKLPDGPKTPALLQTLHLIANPTRFLEDQARCYGDTFTVRVMGYSHPLAFFSDPQSIQAIFTTQAHRFELGKVTHVFRPLTGNESLIMQDGIRHQRQRQLLMPALHGERMYSCGQLICDITQEVTAKWRVGSSLVIQDWMLEISLEVILRVVLGLQPGRRYQSLKQLLHVLLVNVNSPLYSVQFFLPPLQQNLGNWSPWSKFLRLREEIDRLLYAEIEERRTLHPDQAEQGSDILSMLMTAQDEAGQPMTDVELRDQIMTLLLLGHETTASGLAWAFYWLHWQPAALRQLRQELDGKSLDPMKLSQQPYLTAVCKEALRVYPIALIAQPRMVKEVVQLEGYEFEPGTILVPCIYLAHRRPASYPAPEQFQPERFLTGKLSSYEYLPFGGGSRTCIGMALAMFEMKLVLATVLSNYELAIGTPSNRAVRPARRGITFVPPDDFRLVVKEHRSPTF
jgi:cytochrome P450